MQMNFWNRIKDGQTGTQSSKHKYNTVQTNIHNNTWSTNMNIYVYIHVYRPPPASHPSPCNTHTHTYTQHKQPPALRNMCIRRCSWRTVQTLTERELRPDSQQKREEEMQMFIIVLDCKRWMPLGNMPTQHQLQHQSCNPSTTSCWRMLSDDKKALNRVVHLITRYGTGFAATSSEYSKIISQWKQHFAFPNPLGRRIQDISIHIRETHQSNVQKGDLPPWHAKTAHIQKAVRLAMSKCSQVSSSRVTCATATRMINCNYWQLTLQDCEKYVKHQNCKKSSINIQGLSNGFAGDIGTSWFGSRRYLPHGLSHRALHENHAEHRIHVQVDKSL